MAKEQTEKSRYPSKYSPNQFITSAQYILELICEKKATVSGQTLTVQFWKTDKEWTAFYKSQLRICHKLLKIYSPAAIINALNSNESKNIYSLFAPWLIPIIKTEQKKLNTTSVAPTTLPERHNTTSKPRPPQVYKDFSKLLDLDNG